MRPVGAGEAEGFGLEGSGRLQFEPLLTRERVDHFLLLALLAIALLALALCHVIINISIKIY